MRADGGETVGWSLRVASVVGVRHRLAGVGNDDAFAWREGASALLVAVADGVGSVAGAAAAAQAAAAVAVAGAGSAADELGRPDPSVAVTAANAALRGGPGATTLVVAVLAGDGDVELARVGDSSAFVLSGGRWRELFAAPTTGSDDALVDPATAALPSPAPLVETARAHLDADAVLVLVTDGVANPLRDGPETVAPTLASALEGPPDPIELAALVDFSRQGCHDDRTLLGVWRASPPPS